jgi:hypothetical protein
VMTKLESALHVNSMTHVLTVFFQVEGCNPNMAYKVFDY